MASGGSNAGAGRKMALWPEPMNRLLLGQGSYQPISYLKNCVCPDYPGGPKIITSVLPRGSRRQNGVRVMLYEKELAVQGTATLKKEWGHESKVECAVCTN